MALKSKFYLFLLLSWLLDVLLLSTRGLTTSGYLTGGYATLLLFSLAFSVILAGDHVTRLYHQFTPTTSNHSLKITYYATGIVSLLCITFGL